MSITNQVTRVVYTGDTVTTAFATTFPFYDASELNVRKRNTSTNVVTVMAITADYTVSGGAGATGTVTTTGTPLTASEEITIERVTARTQESNYENVASVQESTIEDDFDRLVMQTLELSRDAGRAIHFPRDDDTALSAELPNAEDRASKFLQFDASGNVSVATSVELDPDTVTVGNPGETLLPLATFALWRSTLEVLHRQGGTIDELRGDVIANRPAAATFGNGIFFAVDTGRAYYSNSSAWLEIGAVPSYALASLPASAAANAGLLYVDSTRFNLHVDTGSAVRRVYAPLPRGTIGGLQMTVTGSNLDISVAVGQARVGNSSDPDMDDAYLTAAMVKQLDATWASGTNQGGRPTAVTHTTSTWYHVFLLLNPSTGDVDAGFDTSATAVNLLTDATGYTRYRRLGSVLTDSSGSPAPILDFTQHGDEFLWSDPPLDVDETSAVGTTAILRALSVPPDVQPLALTNVYYNPTGDDTYISSPDADDEAPSSSAGPLGTIGQRATGAAHYAQTQFRVDTSSQVRIRASGTLANPIRIATLGWTDHRGRHD